MWQNRTTAGVTKKNYYATASVTLWGTLADGVWWCWLSELSEGHMFCLVYIWFIALLLICICKSQSCDHVVCVLSVSVSRGNSTDEIWSIYLSWVLLMHVKEKLGGVLTVTWPAIDVDPVFKPTLLKRVTGNAEINCLRKHMMPVCQDFVLFFLFSWRSCFLCKDPFWIAEMQSQTIYKWYIC